MDKTLADMTAEERADCVGMWCEVGDGLEILAEPDGMVDYRDTAILYSTKRNSGAYVLANAITPRFDLPRAWTPDGEPIPAKEVRESIKELTEETWEYAAQAKTGNKWEYMQDGFFRDAWFSELRKAKGGARELRSIGRETRIVRRRVSPPEVINE